MICTDTWTLRCHLCKLFCRGKASIYTIPLTSWASICIIPFRLWASLLIYTWTGTTEQRPSEFVEFFKNFEERSRHSRVRRKLIKASRSASAQRHRIDAYQLCRDYYTDKIVTSFHTPGGKETAVALSQAWHGTSKESSLTVSRSNVVLESTLLSRCTQKTAHLCFSISHAMLVE